MHYGRVMVLSEYPTRWGRNAFLYRDLPDPYSHIYYDLACELYGAYNVYVMAGTDGS
jgi:hypothetical protein